MKLKFSCNLFQENLVTQESSSIIVITNESQWAEACRKLIELDAFDKQSEIPWMLFINILHFYILLATNQINETIERPFMDWEVNYIKKKFFGI